MRYFFLKINIGWLHCEVQHPHYYQNPSAEQNQQHGNRPDPKKFLLTGVNKDCGPTQNPAGTRVFVPLVKYIFTSHI